VAELKQINDDLPSRLGRTGTRVPFGAAVAKAEKQARALTGVATRSKRCWVATKSGSEVEAEAERLSLAGPRLDLAVSAVVRAVESGRRCTAGWTK
jgi:hypothetical protein